MHRPCAALLSLIAILTITPASAAETVIIAASRAVLIKPAAPRASVILMPGGDGAILAGDHGDIHGLNGNEFLRTRTTHAARALAVLVVDVGTDLKSAVDYMAAIKRPVTVIATSAGTSRAAEGIACGARPDALGLTSGMLSPESGPASRNVESVLGSPARPGGVEPFIKWADGRARASWLLGGANEGNPCGPNA